MCDFTTDGPISELCVATPPMEWYWSFACSSDLLVPLRYCFYHCFCSIRSQTILMIFYLMRRKILDWIIIPNNKRRLKCRINFDDENSRSAQATLKMILLKLVQAGTFNPLPPRMLGDKLQDWYLENDIVNSAQIWRSEPAVLSSLINVPVFAARFLAAYDVGAQNPIEAIYRLQAKNNLLLVVDVCCCCDDNEDNKNFNHHWMMMLTMMMMITQFQCQSNAKQVVVIDRSDEHSSSQGSIEGLNESDAASQ